MDAKFSKLCKSVEKYFYDSSDIITEKRNIIKIVNFDEKKYVIKSFKVPNLVNKFAYRFLRASKAKRSYINAKKLIKLGINTPKPICYSENFTLLLNRSYYISEYFDFDFEIRDVLNDNNFNDRENILKEFVKFSYNLHQKGVYHIDYSPGNVLIKILKNRYEFALVDLNRMNFINFSDELRFKNLSRFSAIDEDTEFIAKEYAKISGIDEDFAIKTLKKYDDKHQQYRENKKRLKNLKTTKTSSN